MQLAVIWSGVSTQFIIVFYYFLAARMKNCTLILFLEHLNQKMALQSAYFLKNISLTHISVFWIIVHTSTFWRQWLSN